MLIPVGIPVIIIAEGRKEGGLEFAQMEETGGNK